MMTMNYLPENNLNKINNTALLVNLLKNQGVGKILTDYGYEYLEISSPVPTKPSADIMGVYREKSNAVEYILSMTPLKNLRNKNIIKSQEVVYDSWRSELLDKFNKVQEKAMEQQSKPVFVYCHVLLPHPPFVFDDKGNPLNPPRPFSINDCSAFLNSGGTDEEYLRCYPKQLLFTNEILKQTLGILIKNNKRPKLIIISSDHGPRRLINQDNIELSKLNEAMPIFLAYWHSNNKTNSLDTVNSPVNLYRMVLNDYFDTDYSLLPDKCYYSRWSYPLMTSEIKEKVK